MSGEDSTSKGDSGQGMRKGKPQQLRKRKADSSEDEGDGGKSKEDKTMASAPANKGASANGGKTEKVKKPMSRGLSFATDEGGDEEEDSSFKLKKKSETKAKVSTVLLVFPTSKDA
jgi:hypothetical protein